MPDEDLFNRVRAEFLEMPGLRLKREQLQRLFGVTPRCVNESWRRCLQPGFSVSESTEPTRGHLTVRMSLVHNLRRQPWEPRTHR